LANCPANGSTVVDMTGLALPKQGKRKGGKAKPSQRQFPKGTQKDYCQVCGSTRMIDPPHHIVNKGSGGTSRPEINDPANAITLCRSCHDQAHGRKLPKLSRIQLLEYKLKDEVMKAGPKDLYGE
jgi:5-methylcytosine-specific restriction endonuclease McrA